MLKRLSIAVFILLIIAGILIQTISTFTAIISPREHYSLSLSAVHEPISFAKFIDKLK